MIPDVVVSFIVEGDLLLSGRGLAFVLDCLALVVLVLRLEVSLWDVIEVAACAEVVEEFGLLLGLRDLLRLGVWRRLTCRSWSLSQVLQLRLCFLCSHTI